MNRTSIKQIFRDKDKYLNQNVTVAGWVRTIRGSKSLGFIELNDGSFFSNIQIVMEEGGLENYSEASRLNVGSAIIVRGTLVETQGAKQAFEVKALEINIEGESAPDYPMQKKRHSFEYLRSMAHLRPRTNTFSAVFRVRSLLSYALHTFFNDRGFVYVHTPVITTSDCEGAGEMFKVTALDPANPPRSGEGGVDYSRDFFGKPANLTVSGQLQAEAYAQAFGNVYTFGPTFRAENSNTPRHAAEFWMLEPEIAFADLQDDMDLAEDMLKYIVNYCMEHAPEELEFFNGFIDKGLLERIKTITESDFARITYTEAIAILEKEKGRFEFPVAWGMDLQTEHERYLCETVFNRPVFVTDYPKDIKAFYMRLNDDGRTVAAMDLLVPGVGELIGGSQREERLDLLERRISEMGLPQEPYWWYMELRKYGGVRHAGFGLGFERAVMYLTGMSNIRDVLSFPRTAGSAEF